MLYGIHYVEVIGKRLAHPHENHVGDSSFISQPPREIKHLVTDFRCPQVALIALLPGSAEGAAGGASYLAGNAHGVLAFGGRHKGSFYSSPLPEGEESLDRAVTRFLRFDLFHAGEFDLQCQFVAQGSGKIRHLVYGGGAFLVHPGQQGSGAVFRLAERSHQLFGLSQTEIGNKYRAFGHNNSLTLSYWAGAYATCRRALSRE